MSLVNHEVFVLTAASQGRSSGMICTWLMPATLVPDQPRVIAALSVCNFSVELIEQSRQFVAHLLADDQYSWVPRFGLESGRDRNKFEGICVRKGPDEIPMLPDTCGWMHCRITQRCPTGDRIVVIADVLSQDRSDPPRSPLLKQDALAQLPTEIVDQLRQKAIDDGERDRLLMSPMI